MSYNVVFVGWDRAVPGREAASLELFQEFHVYLGGLQGEGTIDSFETVLLGAHGGDLNGFVLIRGEQGKLDAMQATEDWTRFITRSNLVLQRSGTVHGVTGEMVTQWMSIWSQSMPT